MALFRCLIRGENFPGELIGQAGLVGFYVTRFVEAADHVEAEAFALQELRSDPRLVPPADYTPSDNVRVYFDEIEEQVAGVAPPSPSGFTWYPMKDSEI